MNDLDFTLLVDVVTNPRQLEKQLEDAARSLEAGTRGGWQHPSSPVEQVKLGRSNGWVQVAIDDALGIVRRKARRPDRHTRSDPVLLAAKVGPVGPHDGDDALGWDGLALRFVQIDCIAAIRKRQIVDHGP